MHVKLTGDEASVQVHHRKHCARTPDGEVRMYARWLLLACRRLAGVTPPCVCQAVSSHPPVCP